MARPYAGTIMVFAIGFLVLPLIKIALDKFRRPKDA